MKITNNTVVTFNFVMKEKGTEEILGQSESEPSLYLHGHNNIFSKVEDDMLGKESGDKVNIILSPAEAYGDITDQEPVRVPRKHIATKGKLTKGQVVVVNTDEGMQEARVLKVGLKSVDLDGNHPLAGKTLDFDIEVVSVREATDEEIAHGHSHGEGGHQH